MFLLILVHYAICTLIIFIYRNRISLRFLGIILKVLRLEVSIYNVYTTNQFQTTFAWGGGGGGVKSVSIGDS
jgi:hypothetical protein